MGYRAKKGYTFWEKDFDAMALKTMYRQLISKYGIMSIEMQQAFVNDMTVQSAPETAEETAEPIYFDSETGEAIEE
jgi:recombination protein RecT